MLPFMQSFTTRKTGMNPSSSGTLPPLQSNRKQNDSALPTPLHSEALNVPASKTKKKRSEFTAEPLLKESNRTNQELNIDDRLLKTLMKDVRKTKSPEELIFVIREYESRLNVWDKKINQIRNKRHLQTYLSIKSAVTMLQQLAQHNAGLLGKDLARQVQKQLKQQETTPITSQIEQVAATKAISQSPLKNL